MLDVWVCTEEPLIRLVVPAGGTLPANLGKRDWTLAGPFHGPAEVAQTVAEKGYHFFSSAEAEAFPDGLHDANPADRQFDFK